MGLNMLKELITSGTELKIDLVVSPQKTIEIKKETIPLGKTKGTGKEK